MTRAVRAIAAGAQHAFVPQCGLAPGFISIAAARTDPPLRRAAHRAAARRRPAAASEQRAQVLPHLVHRGPHQRVRQPVRGDRRRPARSRSRRSRASRRSRSTARCYEAFNTSGGLGSLAQTHGAHIETMNYKTIRYPGHCEQMRLLMNDLKLNQDRGTLKRILENAVPQTLQDVVIVYAAVTGMQDGELREENYVSKIYPQIIAGRLWSAIQVTTAAGICAVVDLVLEQAGQVRGVGDAGAVPAAGYPRQPLRPLLRARWHQGRLRRRGGQRQDRAPAPQEGGARMSSLDLNALLASPVARGRESRCLVGRERLVARRRRAARERAQSRRRQPALRRCARRARRTTSAS